MLGNTVAWPSWPSRDYNPEAFLKLTFEIVVLLWFCKACTSLGLQRWFSHRVGVHRSALAFLTAEAQSLLSQSLYNSKKAKSLTGGAEKGELWAGPGVAMLGVSHAPERIYLGEHFATAIWYLLPVWTPLPCRPSGSFI